jgi:hypothetical protein
LKYTILKREHEGESSGTIFGLILKKVSLPAGEEKRRKSRGWRGTFEEDQGCREVSI